MYPVHKRSGLVRAARWTVGSALLVGCAGEDGLSLLVNLTDLPPRSDAVKVSSSLDARPGVLEDGDTKKLQGQPRIAITVPAVAQGTLRINVQTLDTDRCIQGISTVTTQVPFQRGTELSATVSAQSPRSCAPLAACAANQLCPPSQSTSSIQLWQVWAISHQDVWAVGDTVLHFNGTTWNQVSNGLPATTVSLKGVWASGPGEDRKSVV